MERYFIAHYEFMSWMECSINRLQKPAAFIWLKVHDGKIEQEKHKIHV